ncbi:MAG: VWA domain-containing protein [Verrucomicrobiaceae bacterium]|nr:VWA domain-containing protein [Verrucomicrobiaceae bacterium]
MVGLPEIVFVAVLIIALGCEWRHSARVSRISRLIFGPSEKPALWARAAPLARCIAVAGAGWSLLTLLEINPKVYKAKTIEETEIQHVVIVLDVSPSMKLEDAGKGGSLSRRRQAFRLMESFFKRVPMDQMRLSLIAVYNGAKPVVVDTRDADVVRNFLDGVDMYTAFDSGKTHLFDGLELAAEISEDWQRDSTTIILLSDGDTVPAKGMPQMPKSVKGILVVGVGNPVTGTFLDGKNSKQDSSTLRQIALRLGGSYHNGNEKNLPGETIAHLTSVENESPFKKLTRREYALAALAISTIILAMLPVMLVRFGTLWKPGIPPSSKPSK